jgi:hypothetical protein
MPYLSLQSTTLERKLRKGTVVPLNVLVKVPTGAASAEVRGTIEVTRPKPRGQRKHLLDPLVLTLSIRAPSRLDYPEAGYSIEVPPGYEPATTTYRILEQTVHELTLVDPNDPDDALRVTSSNLLAPLSSVEEVWVDDPRSTIRSRSIVNVGSHKTLRVESAGEGGTFVEFHILSGDSIFTVTGPLQNAGLIEQLAGTLTFAG